MATVIKTTGNFKDLGLGFNPPVQDGLISLQLLGTSQNDSLLNRAVGNYQSASIVLGNSAVYVDGASERLTYKTNVDKFTDFKNLGQTLIMFSFSPSSANFQSGDGMHFGSGYELSPLRYKAALTLDGHSGLPYSVEYVIPHKLIGDEISNGDKVNAYIPLSSFGSVLQTKMSMFIGLYNPSNMNSYVLFKSALSGTLKTLLPVIPAGREYDNRNGIDIKFFYGDIAKSAGKKVGCTMVFKRAITDDEVDKIYNWAKGYFDRRGLLGL